MSNPSAPKTPVKDQVSPAKFVKPADLFRMRRRISTNTNSEDAIRQNNSNIDSRANPQIRSSPMGFGPHKRMFNDSPSMNAAKNSPTFYIEAQSPLKCLNNLTDPSPTKKLPTLLRNPFNQPVKRRLNLGSSPRKHDGIKSPNKKTRMLELDEDANLEPPKMKQHSLQNKGENSNVGCYLNDWTLRTRLRINFRTRCKNWIETSTSTHKRLLGVSKEESPSKLNDKTISLEAIKNVATVYQHPYMAWLPLYPRTTSEFEGKKEEPFTLTKHSNITAMMHKDWCESLNDLSNLLMDGKCPYFYMCSDNYNILFKQVPSSNPRKPHVQAYISPFSNGMGCKLNNFGLDFRCPGVISSSSILNNSTRESSQASFGSSQTRTSLDGESSQSSHKPREGKASASVDSGNASDLEEEEYFGEDENDDTSQFLESLGLSQQDFPSLQSRKKSFIEADSNPQSKSSYVKKSLAVIEGRENLLKLVNFLETNRLYTISTVGRFACIPPTLLAPCEFRLSTPQHPEVILSKKMIETVPHNLRPNSVHNSSPRKSGIDGTNVGPTFIELKGTILPNLFDSIHKLLRASDNMDHSCQSTGLETSLPFNTLPFT